MYWFTWKNNWFFLRGSPLFSFPFFPHFYEILHDEQLKVSYICATKKYTSAYELQFVRNADRNENKNMNDIYSKRWLRTTKKICKCLEVHICHLSRVLEVHICHRKSTWTFKLKSILWKSNSQIFRNFNVSKFEESSIFLRHIDLKTFLTPI